MREVWPELAPFADAMQLIDGKHADLGIEGWITKNGLEFRADGLFGAQEDVCVYPVADLRPDLGFLGIASV